MIYSKLCAADTLLMWIEEEAYPFSSYSYVCHDSRLSSVATKDLRTANDVPIYSLSSGYPRQGWNYEGGILIGQICPS